MLMTTRHICSSTCTAQKETLVNSSKPLALVRSCCVESSFCSLRFAEYLSTGERVYGFIRATGNSERWKMTEKEDNVGFLATGSGVKQFQLSLGGCFVLQCRRLTKHTSDLRGSAAAQKKTGTFDSRDTMRGTPRTGVPENVPLRHASVWTGARVGHAPSFGLRPGARRKV